METIDIAVIGGGVAGLAAADELHRKSGTVAVFEARDRIGGRILTPPARTSPSPASSPGLASGRRAARQVIRTLS
jgi:monoamine oxidase